MAVLRVFIIAMVGLASAVTLGCGSTKATADGGPGGTSEAAGAAGASGTAGASGAAGAAGGTGAGGAAGVSGVGGAAGLSGTGGGPVDAGSSHTSCHTNTDCTPPEVCYLGASSGGCAGPAGQCVRMTSPCTAADKCTCLDIVRGSCSGVSGGFGCQEQGTGPSCWVCLLPI